MPCLTNCSAGPLAVGLSLVILPLLAFLWLSRHTEHREVLLEETEGAESEVTELSRGDWVKAISAVEASTYTPACATC